MGFTPQQVNAMSMWEYLVAVDGYMEAHAGEQDGLSNSEVDELWEWMKERG